MVRAQDLFSFMKWFGDFQEGDNIKILAILKKKKI